MRHENSRELFNYWNALRGERPAPERSEIEPGEIRAILGDTFILEVSPQMRTIAFRLAGTRLCAAYGRELKGLGILALWSEDDNFDLARTVNLVYRDSIPMLLSYSARSKGGRFVEYESILLPLMPAPDGNSRILGVASPKKPPYWLGSDALICNHLRSARRIESRPAPTQSPLALEPEKPKIAKRTFGHLTVLDGGKSIEATK